MFGENAYFLSGGRFVVYSCRDDTVKYIEPKRWNINEIYLEQYSSIAINNKIYFQGGYLEEAGDYTKNLYALDLHSNTFYLCNVKSHDNMVGLQQGVL